MFIIYRTIAGPTTISFASIPSIQLSQARAPGLLLGAAEAAHGLAALRQHAGAAGGAAALGGAGGFGEEKKT